MEAELYVPARRQTSVKASSLMKLLPTRVQPDTETSETSGALWIRRHHEAAADEVQRTRPSQL